MKKEKRIGRVTVGNGAEREYMSIEEFLKIPMAPHQIQIPMVRRKVIIDGNTSRRKVIIDGNTRMQHWAKTLGNEKSS